MKKSLERLSPVSGDLRVVNIEDDLSSFLKIELVN